MQKKRKYGKRPGLKAVDIGARKAAPTFGGEAALSYGDKGGGVRVFENDAERLVSKLLGIDPRVRRFQTQPFAVDLIEGRLLRTAEQRDAARRNYAGRSGPALYGGLGISVNLMPMLVFHGGQHFLSLDQGENAKKVLWA